ncbi:MAG TPA: hypothetical protein VMH87_10325 [Pseudomonadales bacterium]|nr:hypothetical protein [Pseudomonadales bacterium]
MSHRLFELFAKMVAELPVRAIPRVLDLECLMLEADARNQRLAFPEDARSIFCFWHFVQAARAGHIMLSPKPLPPDHVDFFKETTLRLVHADELPASAIGQFDDIFVPSLFVDAA